MQRKIRIAEGRRIRNPRKKGLPVMDPSVVHVVAWDSFWERRRRDGDIELVDEDNVLLMKGADE